MSYFQIRKKIMFAPSIDVGDDLRQYARKREDEMRQRVEVYRRTKEDELKNELAEKVRDFEITKLLVANKHLLKQRSCLDDLEDMCERLEEKVRHQSVEYPVAETDPITGELLKEFSEKLEEVRFEKECGILSLYKSVENACVNARSAAQHELVTDLRNQIGEVASGCVNDLEAIRDELSRLSETKALSRRSQLGNFEATIDDFLLTASHEITKTFETESLEIQDHLRDRLESQRRRLVITLEKRIYDLSRTFDPRSTPEAMEAKSMYQNELLELFVVYLELISGSQNKKSRNQLPSGSISSGMNSHNVSEKNRIKFITSFFEKFACRDLFSSLLATLRQDVSVLSLGS